MVLIGRIEGIRVAAAALAAIVGAGACQPVVQEQPSQSWESYTAPDQSFEVAYPANLEFREFDGSDLDPEGTLFAADEVRGVIFASDGSPSLAGSVALFGLGAEFEPTEIRLGVSSIRGPPWETAKEASEFFRTSFQIYEGHEELAFGPVDVGEEQGYQVVLSNLGQLPDGTEVPQVLRMAFLVAGNRMYAIGGGAFRSTYEEQEEVFDRFLASFKLLREPTKEALDETPGALVGEGKPLGLSVRVNIFEEALEQGPDEPTWRVSRQACESFIREAESDPRLGGILLMRKTEYTRRDVEAVEAAIGWGVAASAEVFSCVEEYGPLSNGDFILTVYGSWLALANILLQSPELEAVVDASMRQILDKYPDSCYRKLARQWLRERDIPSPDEAAAACD